MRMSHCQCLEMNKKEKRDVTNAASLLRAVPDPYLMNPTCLLMISICSSFLLLYSIFFSSK